MSLQEENDALSISLLSTVATRLRAEHAPRVEDTQQEDICATGHSHLHLNTLDEMPSSTIMQMVRAKRTIAK